MMSKEGYGKDGGVSIKKLLLILVSLSLLLATVMLMGWGKESGPAELAVVDQGQQGIQDPQGQQEPAGPAVQSRIEIQSVALRLVTHSNLGDIYEADLQVGDTVTGIATFSYNITGGGGFFVRDPSGQQMTGGDVPTPLRSGGGETSQPFTVLATTTGAYRFTIWSNGGGTRTFDSVLRQYMLTV